MDWRKWSKPRRLFDGDRLLSGVPASPGAYIISVGRPLHRALGIDNRGIIDIGESKNLHSRIGSFVRCASSPDVFGHMAGVRFSRIRAERHFPLSELQIAWNATNSKTKAVELEADALSWYVEHYLELPPLNYKFNNALLRRL